ncbi:aminopeptidase Y [Arthrobacter crystallopoietes BAB-32]|uniref:Aminopeptidase Y n=1 Tax=Arthrobacter crystallopoietes BAB-32 TaxID=1246476 RepID=N1UTE8_9MICC|nr:M20/M25/M40 family metallo-hydrolase [Arthrobacter crystallopoietes]EMY33691.1 aminopeptidase Y [Arthrobacter crystallopoietes BAB-32]
MKHQRTTRAVAVSAVVLLALGLGGTAQAAPDITEKLRKAVKTDNVVGHLEELQEIAEANGGNRASGNPGYEAAAEYVEEQLRDAGYDPQRQYFDYQQFIEHSPAELQQVAPVETTYEIGTRFRTMEYSGAGDVTAAVTAVDVNFTDPAASTSGCEAADFEGFPAGNIALIQRGTCTFGEKAQAAAAAKAAGVIIFNQGNGEGRTDVLNGTLGEVTEPSIPAVGGDYALGVELAADPDTTVRIKVDGEVLDSTTFNILADTKGNADETVVVGAHFDSVAEGAGINDNGSGTAAVLETAIQLAKTKAAPENRVRFAFWGAEESGLIGSEYYVSELSEAEIAQHALNLNFDMVGSPNGVRFVYDGDGSEFGQAGPEGSAEIEKVFADYFASQGLASAETEYSGRSDYAPFIAAGIPAGGLFTGAEGTKTKGEAAIFGGTAGEAYDPCYHTACDDLSNIDEKLLGEMADAIVYATATFAEVQPHKGKGKGHEKGKGLGHNNGNHGHWDHQGHSEQR